VEANTSVSTFDGKFSAYSIRVFLKSDACTGVTVRFVLSNLKSRLTSGDRTPLRYSKPMPSRGTTRRGTTRDGGFALRNPLSCQTAEKDADIMGR